MCEWGGVILFLFLRQESHYVSLAGLELACRLGWPWTHGGSPALPPSHSTPCLLRPLDFPRSHLYAHFPAWLHSCPALPLSSSQRRRENTDQNRATHTLLKAPWWASKRAQQVKALNLTQEIHTVKGENHSIPLRRSLVSAHAPRHTFKLRKTNAWKRKEQILWWFVTAPPPRVPLWLF